MEPTDRHTCHDQRAATGPAWKCPRCSAAPLPPAVPSAETPREQLLAAIDGTRIPPLGYGTPEELLAAYDADRAVPVDPAGLRETVAAALREHGMVHLGDQVPADEYECCADVALTAVLPAVSAPAVPRETAASVLAVVEAALGDTLTPDGRVEALAGIAAVLPATTRHDTDERIEQAEADAELHARNTETVARERESYRAAWKDEQRRRAEAEAELKRLRCMVDEYGDGAGALTRKLKRVRDLHRETCPSGLSCGMCELLDAPAAPLRRVADETAATETHVCKPGASTYYCPTSGETESDCHGGFDVCCARPDLHQPTDEACQQLAELLDTVRACAEAWAWPSMSAPSRAAGEHLLRLLDAEPAAGARQDGADRG